MRGSYSGRYGGTHVPTDHEDIDRIDGIATNNGEGQLLFGKLSKQTD